MAALPPEVRGRIHAVRDEIESLGLISSGTVLRRHKVCGKSGCRCAEDRSARHGPYYEWNRLEGGKLAHRSVTAAEAKALLRAIRNARRLRRLLRKWEEASVAAILTRTE